MTSKLATFSFFLFFIIERSLGSDITYTQGLMNYGCIDPSNPLAFFRTDLLSEEEKKFVSNLFPKDDELTNFEIESKTKDQIVSNEDSKKTETIKKVRKKTCGIEVDKPEEEFNPSNYIKFPPVSVKPECFDRNIKIDPTCEVWFEESLSLVQSNLPNYSDLLPLEIELEGHTNSVTDKTLTIMIGADFNVQPKGIFTELGIDQEAISIKKDCVSKDGKRLKKNDSCQKRLESFRSSYLTKLSKRRADIQKERLVEYAKKTGKYKILTKEEYDKQRTETKRYYENTIEAENTLIKLAEIVNDSDIDQLRAKINKCVVFPVESSESEVPKINQKCDGIFAGPPQLSAVLNRYLLMHLKNQRLKFELEKNSPSIYLDSTIGKGDSEKIIRKKDFDDRKIKDNQRVEIKGHQAKLEFSDHSDILENFNANDTTQLSCNLVIENENKIGPRNNELISGIVQKYSKIWKDSGKYHINESNRLSEQSIQFNKDDKTEDCQRFISKDNDMSEEERKLIEAKVINDLIKYRFFGKNMSSCTGSNENEDFSMDQFFSPEVLVFDFSFPNENKNSFFEYDCMPKENSSIIESYKDLIHFDVKDPRTWKSSILKHKDKFQCFCGERGKKEKECSMDDVVKSAVKFFESDLGKKVVSMKEELDQFSNDFLGPEDEIHHVKNLDEIEAAIIAYSGCKNKDKQRERNLKKAISELRTEIDPVLKENEIQVENANSLLE